MCSLSPPGLLLKDVQEREDICQDLFVLTPNEMERLEHVKSQIIYPEITKAMHDQENDYTKFMEDFPNYALPDTDLAELKTLGERYMEQIQGLQEVQ